VTDRAVTTSAPGAGGTPAGADAAEPTPLWAGARTHRDPLGPGRSPLPGRTFRDTGAALVGRSFLVMESDPSVPVPSTVTEPSASVAEGLPELYRAILERVADLERLCARAEAGRIRVEATRTYSSSWDEGARRVLLGLLVRADRTAVAPVRPRGWSFRRRFAATR
jgi:hypothetical protein